jgi:glutamate racemase
LEGSFFAIFAARALKVAATFGKMKSNREEAGEIMPNANDYIAVFDSGVGGLSVLRHLLRAMPGERFLYFGDSANAPYGIRPPHEIRQLTLAAAENLVARGIKALVVACNTATSIAIEDLRQKYPQLIVIGIEPALKLAADHFPGGRIGVMATPVTLQEEKFARLLQRYEDHCAIHKLPAPGLVELIESGNGNTPETRQLLHSLLAPYAGKLDALVLGCTHYPFAAAEISAILGAGTTLLDGGEGTARETRRRLEGAGLLENGSGELIIENSGGAEMVALSHRLLHL